MDFNIIKEVCVEYCENMYAITTNYLNNHNNDELKEILEKIVVMEDKVRICDDINQLFNYKRGIENLMNRIEVIINA